MPGTEAAPAVLLAAHDEPRGETPVAQLHGTVFLCVDGPALDRTLAAALTGAGLQVRSIGGFQDLIAWLLASREAPIVVVELPALEMFRKTALREIRRVAPTAALVILCVGPSTEIEQEAGGARLLPRDASPEEVVAAV